MKQAYKNTLSQQKRNLGKVWARGTADQNLK